LLQRQAELINLQGVEIPPRPIDRLELERAAPLSSQNDCDGHIRLDREVTVRYPDLAVLCDVATDRLWREIRSQADLRSMSDKSSFCDPLADTLPTQPNVNDRSTSTPAHVSNSVANSAPQNAPDGTVVPDQCRSEHDGQNDDGTPFRDYNHAFSSSDQDQCVRDVLAVLGNALTPHTSNSVSNPIPRDLSAGTAVPVQRKPKRDSRQIDSHGDWNQFSPSGNSRPLPRDSQPTGSHNAWVRSDKDTVVQPSVLPAPQPSTNNPWQRVCQEIDHIQDDIQSIQSSTDVSSLGRSTVNTKNKTQSLVGLVQARAAVDRALARLPSASSRSSAVDPDSITMTDRKEGDAAWNSEGRVPRSGRRSIDDDRSKIPMTFGHDGRSRSSAASSLRLGQTQDRDRSYDYDDNQEYDRGGGRRWGIF